MVPVTNERAKSNVLMCSPLCCQRAGDRGGHRMQAGIDAGKYSDDPAVLGAAEHIGQATAFDNAEDAGKGVQNGSPHGVDGGHHTLSCGVGCCGWDTVRFHAARNSSSVTSMQLRSGAIFPFSVYCHNTYRFHGKGTTALELYSANHKGNSTNAGATLRPRNSPPA